MRRPRKVVGFRQCDAALQSRVDGILGAGPSGPGEQLAHPALERAPALGPGLDPTGVSSAAIERRAEPLLTCRLWDGRVAAIRGPQLTGIVQATLYKMRLL